jgi:putative transposase
MPQSLHILTAHIIFSTRDRRPFITPDLRERLWGYQSRILQNLGCDSITVGGVADHVHILCNLTKKFPTVKVIEILKKDSSKFIKTLDTNLRDVTRNYILNQEPHHKKETFQEEYLRILKKYHAPYDERYLWD